MRRAVEGAGVGAWRLKLLAGGSGSTSVGLGAAEHIALLLNPHCYSTFAGEIRYTACICHWADHPQNTVYLTKYGHKTSRHKCHAHL